ncbi:Caveolin-1 [Holothuria leucospilota]|uniref:Caveolin n=1 Tax=Holothuria leucospilota TaxID=206669 RepID=A0A9Q0YFI7_HOLLE|nr:Caveolin-1 [Holothuria leucospilota]
MLPSQQSLVVSSTDRCRQGRRYPRMVGTLIGENFYPSCNGVNRYSQRTFDGPPSVHQRLAGYSWPIRFLYVVFSCLLGPFLAFFFGMVFAIFQFIRIWMVNPVVRICQFNITCLEMIYRPCIRTVLDPCFEAVCQAWRRVTSTERSYKLKITGLALGQNAAQPQETT